jgi:hypothetical protein
MLRKFLFPKCALLHTVSLVTRKVIATSAISCNCNCVVLGPMLTNPGLA